MRLRRRRATAPSAETVEARRRLEQAQADLDAARADTARVDEVAAAIRERITRNRLGPLIAEALRGGPAR